MKFVSSCPASGLWQSLRDARLSDEERRALQDHVRTCSRCQDTLASLPPDDVSGALLAGSMTVEGKEASQQLLDQIQSHRSGLDTKAGTFATNQPVSESSTLFLSSWASLLKPAQTPDELGRLGTYRLLKVLGKGGMGIVFRAEDLQLGRPVALKIMKPELAESESSRKRFVREARAAAAIKNEFVVTIYQVGEDGVPFLAMEFLEGDSLDVHLQRVGRPELPDALRIGREIALGLAAAHARGLIHRDIKPGNIFLEAEEGERGSEVGDQRSGKDEGTQKRGPVEVTQAAMSGSLLRPPTPAPRPPLSGHVKLLDFGLARPAEEAGHLTESGAVVGTPAYMAPEQARGEHVDHRADLFSLGCLLYRLVTGKLPFDGTNTTAVLLKITTGEAIAPKQLEPAIPQPLSDLIMKLLEKDPAKRPASAKAVADQLLDFSPSPLVGEGRGGGAGLATSTPPPQPSPIKGEGARWPVAVAAIAIVFAVLAYFFGGTLIRVATNQGELIVKVSDPNVEVQVRQNGVEVTDKSTKRQFILTAKSGEIDVFEPESGLKVLTKKFELGRGGKSTIEVTLEEIASAKPKKDTKPAQVKTDTAPTKFALDLSGPISKEKFPHVELPAALRPSDPITVEVFVTPRRVVVSKCVVFNLNGRLMLNQLNGYWFWEAPIPKDPGLPKALAANKEQLQPGKRVYLSAVSTGSELRLFVEGRLVKTAPIEHKLQTLPTLSALGFPGGPNFMPFDGTIDGARISKTARYEKDFTPPKQLTADADTVMLYNFDEGQGDVLKDSSGNKHHGKIVGAKWVKLSDATDPDRRAAEWVLSIGGTVDVRVGGDFRAVKTAKELPTQTFRLESIHAQGCKVVDADLGILNGLPNLGQLKLMGTLITDDGLKALKHVPNLSTIWLGGTRISDEGMAHLKALPKLNRLDLNDARQITDAGLIHLKTLTHLEGLVLTSTRVSDAGLEHLKGLTKLKNLYVGNTKVTPAGVASLQKTLPGCKVITDAVAAIDPDRRAAEWVLSIGGTVGVYVKKESRTVKQSQDLPGEAFTLAAAYLNKAEISDEELQNLAGLKGLEVLTVESKSVTGEGLTVLNGHSFFHTLDLRNSGVTDAGLRHVRNLPALYGLILAHTQVTDAGLKHVAECKRLASLSLTDLPITDSGLAALAPLTKLDALHLANTKVSDAGLSHIAKLKELKTLYLTRTAITDKGLPELKGLTKLTLLNVRFTKVSAAGVASLAKAMPNCRINSDHGTFGPIGAVPDLGPGVDDDGKKIKAGKK